MFEKPTCEAQPGVEYWYGLMNQELVFQAKTQIAHPRYFLPVWHDQAVISHCLTHPAYRGRGLYRQGLIEIMRSLSRRSITVVYIDCYEWNWPSRSGIEAAGFKKIGCGWDRQGRLTFRPCPSDKDVLQNKGE